MGRILAIDYGRKRTGLAVTDPLQLIAGGLTTVPTHTLMEFLRNYTQREEVERIVVGLPRQMNHEMSETMQQIAPFVRSLQKQLPHIAVEYADERFTSVLAQRTMREAGLKKKDRQNKALVDEISATIILQSYLESRRGAGGVTGTAGRINQTRPLTLNCQRNGPATVPVACFLQDFPDKEKE